ncbi:transaldolase [Diplodia corticola]|uniref:Transaldolase n=1 Tax=Diplodia corticola TaxID=236234 RepID=A0A1J9RBS6_9PEZI|nr:transaldolase [Diplodia corticola]OJD37913.1 transaldolase [Diplodia corticola]
MPPTSSLDQLRAHTTIVADTGDFAALSAYASTDATTNPSHILTALRLPQSAHLLRAAVAHARAAHPSPSSSPSSATPAQIDAALLHLLVSFGCEILAHVPGRVSTEVDPAHAFSAAATIAYARRLIAAYEARGVGRARVLVKVPGTWEGFAACEALEREGIACNVTLVFGLHPQGVRAAEVRATLVSPFVGRTLDWWHAKRPGVDYSGAKDPGVVMCRRLWEWYRARGVETEVMGASMRSVEECRELCGLDLMTMNVGLLQELKEAEVEMKPVLVREKVAKVDGSVEDKSYANDEAAFRMDLFNDHAAHDKMTDMMRQFLRDAEATKAALKELLEAA